MVEHSRGILCIVPGWGGTKETWKEFIAHAKDFFDVRCIELPCFGGVSCPSTVWGVEQFADYVNLQIAEIKKENPNSKLILLGHSFGGQVATCLAGRQPRLFDELVLIAPAVIRPKRKIKRAIFKVMAQMGKSILGTRQNNTKISEIKRKMYNAFFSPDYTNTHGIEREIFKKVIREDMRDVLPSITSNVLLFWGAQDTYTPLRHGRRIQKMLPQSELVIFPTGKHGLHHTHTADILMKLKERYTGR